MPVSGSESVTLQSAAAATGNGTALDVTGDAVAAVQITGTFNATVTFEATVDGSNWTAVEAVNLGDGTKATTATAPGFYVAPVYGAASFRARISTWVSGTVTAVGRGEPDVGLTLADVSATIGATVAATVSDGADVTLGATADAAVDTDTTGTVSGKLRGLVKLVVNLLSRWPAALGAGGGLKVDGSGTALPVSGTVTASGPLTDTQLRATAVPVSGTVTATPSGTQAASVADGADVAQGATSDADTALTVIGRLKKIVALLAGGLPAALSSGGGVKTGVVDALPAGTNNIGDVDVLTIAAGANLIGDVGIQGRATGGLTIFRSIDLDEGTLEIVKASAGTVYGMWVTNTATTTRWIKFYDATSGTAGTGTPVITIGIPGNTTDDVAGNFGPGGAGIAFATGICVGATTGVADNDTGAPGANDVICNVWFK